MVVFETHNSNSSTVLMRCLKVTYLCKKYGSNSVFGYLVWVCPHSAKNCMVLTWCLKHTYQICQQHCFQSPSMGVLEVNNAKNRGALMWRPNCAYLWTKCASSIIFRISSMDVFEIDDAKSRIFLTWLLKRRHLSTKHASNRAFGYLVWV